MVGRKTKNFSPENIFDFIFKEERRSSVLLLIAAITALVFANSSWASSYYNFFSHYVTLGPVTLDIKHWINEGLMALFFLVVSLEVKREFINGELKAWKNASFPVVAAIGGMVVPALIFILLNPKQSLSNGWAIPMATDIAIALGVIGILGNRLSKSLRVFLLTLAIVDDIGSIIVISLFYNRPSNMFALILAFAFALGLIFIRKYKIWPFWFFVFGITLWYCLLMAGVSATIAGVITAFLMPFTVSNKKNKKLKTPELVEDLLIPITSFLIVPLFVFANAGITFSGVSLEKNGSASVFIGILLGLFIGKPVGILLASWVGHITRITQKPRSISWSQLAGVGFVAGIGFTISVLIADLAYKQAPVLHDAAILGIFSASIASGMVGLLILFMSKNKTKKLGHNFVFCNRKSGSS